MGQKGKQPLHENYHVAVVISQTLIRLCNEGDAAAG